jgi:glycosyltransferase involved in cell wall biosynthesis
MHLSVIIPTFNRLNLIKYTLESLDKAHHNNIEIEVIVIDDGSTDGTWQYIQENYPHVRLIRNKSKGAAAARNTGLAAATGKYINYLDSDDLAGENYYGKKLEYLEQNAEIKAVYGAYEYFRSEDALSADKIMFKYKYPYIETPGKAKEHLINYLGGNFLPQNSIIWRKEFLNSINGHDSALGVNQDVDLFVRAIFKGLKITAIDDGTKVYVRDHEIDNRVGDPKNSGRKWEQILELRKNIYKDLATYGYAETASYRALSQYLFGYWKILRHKEPGIAAKYLKFAKEVYWPVEIKGNIGYRMLSKIFGPEKAVNIKYYLLKRD